MDRSIWLTLDDVRAVEATFSSGRATVFVSLKPDAARRLEPSIVAHKRHFLAIVLNGHFIDAPFITASVATIVPVVIDGDSTLATELVDRLRAQIAAASGKRSQ